MQQDVNARKEILELDQELAVGLWNFHWMTEMTLDQDFSGIISQGLSATIQISNQDEARKSFFLMFFKVYRTRYSSKEHPR